MKTDLTKPLQIELGATTGTILVSTHETDQRGNKVIIPLSINRSAVLRLLREAPALLDIVKRQSGQGAYVTQEERLALINKIEKEHNG